VGYESFNTAENFIAPDPAITEFSSHIGGCIFFAFEISGSGGGTEWVASYTQYFSTNHIHSFHNQWVSHFHLNGDNGTGLRHQLLRAQLGATLCTVSNTNLNL
jgi:hypothetical protein